MSIITYISPRLGHARRARRRPWIAALLVLAIATTLFSTEDPFLRRTVDYLEQKVRRAAAGGLAPLELQDSGKVTV